MADDVERRACPADLRAEPGDTPRLSGHAIVVNTLSEDLGGFRERISAEALTRALERRPDLVALVDHDRSRVLGRQSAGTLVVGQDARGLAFTVAPPRHEAGLLESVQRGDLRGASFEFKALKDTWDLSATPPIRTIDDMALREISLGVAFPAYPDTTVARRSLDVQTRQERITMEQPTPPAPQPDLAPPTPPALDPQLEREQRKFSLRALVAGAAGLPGVDWGREREISQETARRSGRTFDGYAVPMHVFEQRIVTTALPAGGPGANIIATDYRGDQYIDRLRAALRIRQLGARVLSGLTGNVAIPRLKTSATGGWVAENAALTPSDPEFEQVTLSPKHVGALVEWSRNLLLQPSPDIEDLMRDDFAKVLARAVDAAAINGSGTAGQPLGILGTSGIGDVALGTAGGAPTWASVVSLVGVVEQADAAPEGGAFLTNAKATAKMRSTVRVATTDSRMIMEERTTLAGYPLSVSSLVPSTLVKGGSGAVCSALIFGDWSDLLLGYWSELDLLVNPYDSTAYPKGNVLLRGFISMDLKLRHPQSFGAIKDMLTT